MPVNIPVVSQPRVVIIGGGFGGLELAKRLKRTEAQVVLIDKNNYHTFQPLLYQVATAALEPDSVAYPLREILKKKKHQAIFRMAEVVRVRPDDNRLETSIGEIDYDYLVIASGSRTNFFGMDDVRANAMRMKSIPQALELRTMILESFEQALLIDDLSERDRLMTFVIVGGGPTGVELAGSLGELKKIVLPHDYPELNLNDMQLHVVDKEDRVLKAMSPEASRHATRFLKDMGINFWLGTKVNGYDGKTVSLSNGKELKTSNLIWAAGVTGAVIPGLPTGSIAGGRIKTDATHKVEGYDNIFSIGDVAAVITEETPRGYPMLAPVAIQQADTLAANLRKHLRGEEMRPFRYRDKGVMATVGRSHAVVDLHWLKFHGFLGWMVWLFVHLMSLVGFRNRLVVLINWAWNYFSYDRGLRLIIRPSRRSAGNSPGEKP